MEQDREERPFAIKTRFDLCGDQPEAVARLCEGIRSGVRDQTLLGVTGSGKTFTMAKVIAEVQRPALILAPNKTLAGQLYSEFKELFPDNAVGYFISYYDYYQPEAYIPSSDTYIAKDANINDRIDRMRHAATAALLTRRDVIIVASVSCIYGLGSPEVYGALRLDLHREEDMDRDHVLRRLVQLQYARNDVAPRRATFRVRGDVVEIFPAFAEDRIIRLEFFGDTIESIDSVDALTGEVVEELDSTSIFPSSHYVTTEDRLQRALVTIREELVERLDHFERNGRLVEAQRLEMRTRHDLELLEELGSCAGIENYSRHLDGRGPGEPPATLLDYFPDDFILFVDESHISLPQVRGMYRGDRSRKSTLVEHGFRLPSALDNRPLNYDEFQSRLNQAVYVSATPGEIELQLSGGITAEQVIRPTGLLDPVVEVRPARGQVDDLLGELGAVAEAGYRALVTCLTKRMAEDLTTYFQDLGGRVRYLHSDIDALDRTEILRSLRMGDFDVLVGINLLREGLDLPEVALVAILDADKEGFLRSRDSLIQTIGRAARNAEGRVILYADRITDSIKAALDETERRRRKQSAYNEKHGITPRTIVKPIADSLEAIFDKDYVTVEIPEEADEIAAVPPDRVDVLLNELREAMFAAAAEQRYEEAAEIRDRVARLERRLLREV